MIDLSKLEISAEAGATLVKACQYQPFRFPNRVHTGAGLSQVRATKLRHASEADSDDREVSDFLTESKNQAVMYEQFIAAVADAVGGMSGKTFLDVACNAGYFCYRMDQLGAARSIGVDVTEYDDVFNAINSHLGTNAHFVRGGYDMRRHEVQGVEDAFDLVFNIAFMCHSSDPTFLLEALAKKAKKALLIYSIFPPSNDYFVRHSRATSKYFGGTFPLCFDAMTEMSDSLLVFGLKSLGFTTVTEIERPGYWVPRGDTWRAFLAVR